MNGARFDFVVVGAGSAGCVLAERLSRSGRHSVLLVEAGGGDRRPDIQVPIGYGFTFRNPTVNWMYSAEPDPGLNGRVAYWPRGRVLGGSSSINAMVYCRGLPLDFDDWSAAGATGWGWDAVRPVFERTETKARRVNGRLETTGNGPLWVTDETDQVHPLTARFIEGAREAQWPITSDTNSDRWEGLGFFHNNTRMGWRCSSASAFLKPALRRPNLTVLTKAMVDRILFDGKKATGISIRKTGRSQTVFANREVIVSAGAVNSPKLLQLSGLGPAEHLRERGVEVLQDMPEVGGGMQDHLAITYLYESNEPSLNGMLYPLHGRAWVALRYALTRRGPLSMSINQCGGFLKSGPDRAFPDMQIYCNPATYSSGGGDKPRLDPAPGFLLSFQPCRPTSRGRIDIASPDPDAPPRIRPNSLSTEDDRAAVLRGARLLGRLIDTPTIKRLVKRPRQQDPSTMSDEEIHADFAERGATNYHPTCTCRMGPDKANSVLDSRLKVHGVEALRVVDASAFPNITSGNTNAPTIMLAQRGADLILEDAGETVTP